MKVVATARAIDQQFTDLRRFVREYASSGNESLIVEAESRRQKVSASLALAKSIVRNPARTAKLNDIADRFDAYTDIFSKLVNLKREQMKLTSESLDSIGKTLRLALEDLHDSDLADRRRHRRHCEALSRSSLGDQASECRNCRHRPNHAAECSIGRRNDSRVSPARP